MFFSQKSSKKKGLKTIEENLLKKSKNKKKSRIIHFIQNMKRDNSIPYTAQDSIPIDRIFKDGVCRVANEYYSISIAFNDINYDLAKNEDREEILNSWGNFLNFFDSSIQFSFSFINLNKELSDFQHMYNIPLKNDGYDEIRKEYSSMLQIQVKKSTLLTKKKCITFAIKEESMEKAKPRLQSICEEILNNFKRIGVEARVLGVYERLLLIHDIFHIDTKHKFHFTWEELIKSGMSFKDVIAPSSFYFPNGRYFKIGNIYGAMSFLSFTASEIPDIMLKDILSSNFSQILTLHVKPVDQAKALKHVKSTITELDRSKIEENKKAVRAGYDMDILPSDLVSYGEDAKNLLKELQSKNERYFMITFLILNVGKSKEELESNIFKTSSIVQKYSCDIFRLDYQQENGLMSSLPLAYNQIEIERGMTSSGLAILMPFMTYELQSKSKDSLYYGLNSLSKNLILIDRKESHNPNGLILGVPGSGKSFAVKREIVNCFLMTDDDIIICDPEYEYLPLIKKLKGQIIKISTNSQTYINPLDINLNYSEGKNPIALKSDFILSFCELVIKREEGLKAGEITVIDRCVAKIYEKYLSNPIKENIPVLEDLYNELLKQKEEEAKYVATAIEIYVKGSLKIFNHRTNVDIHNRVVCYDISELGKSMSKIGMLIVQDQVWGRVSSNRNKGKSTRYYMDEFHLLLREEQTAFYALEFWKRFRKWGGVPTGITQNVKDFLGSHEIESIFDNTNFIYMLEQGANDREILARFLHISEAELTCITKSERGEGLLYYGGIKVPVEDKFPTNLELYKLMSTKFGEFIHENL